MGMAAAVRVALGMDFGRFDVEKPGRVLILAWEDDSQDLFNRLAVSISAQLKIRPLQAVGSRPRKLLRENLHVVAAGELGLKVHELSDLIEERSRQLDGLDLVIIDPASRAFALGKGSLKDDEVLRELADQSEAIARTTGAAVWVFTHSNQRGVSYGGTFMQAPWRGMVRLSEPKEKDTDRFGLSCPADHVLFAMEHYNNEIEREMLLRREWGGALVPLDAQPSGRAKTDSRDGALRALVAALGESPDGAKAKDIFPDDGDRARNRLSPLKKAGWATTIGGGRATRWTLTDEGRARLAQLRDGNPPTANESADPLAEAWPLEKPS
jgi:hypothetical protein